MAGRRPGGPVAVGILGHDPARTASTHGLRGPATRVSFGRTVLLSVGLTLSVGAAPARSRIIITRRRWPAARAHHLLRIGLVNPNGGVSVRYVPS